MAAAFLFVFLIGKSDIQLMLHQSKVRIPQVVSSLQHDCRVPSPWAILSHKEGAGWDAGPLGFNPAHIWDPSVCKGRILAAIALGCCFLSNCISEVAGVLNNYYPIFCFCFLKLIYLKAKVTDRMEETDTDRLSHC